MQSRAGSAAYTATRRRIQSVFRQRWGGQKRGGRECLGKGRMVRPGKGPKTETQKGTRIMFNPINRNNAVQPSIKALALLGPVAMKVIVRNKSITAIAAYEQTLGPKVVHFKEVRVELKDLVAAYKEATTRSDAAIGGLDAVTRVWSANLQLGTSLDSEEVGITSPRTPKGILDNAENVMDTLRKREGMPFVSQALSEIETQYGSALADYDAARDGRSAVQLKQRELRAVAVEVQKELVKLRTVVRIALGVSSADYQELRIRNVRVADADDESPPETAEGSPAADATTDPGAGSSTVG